MFKLIDLPYEQNALEPVISAQTLSFHHGKHLQTYVDNLNKLLPGSGLEDLPLEQIVAKASGALFNNAGQVLNHNMYFTQFKTPDQVGGDGVPVGGDGVPVGGDGVPVGGDGVPVVSDASSVMPGPTGHLKAQIEKQWASVDAFKTEFEAKGVGLFGSGWVWLSSDEEGKLFITQEGPAGNPVTRVPGSASVMPGSASSVMPGQTGHLRPLLTFDVWEHAYYLDYQNRRAAHLSALWQIVNWKVIEERLNSNSVNF